MSTWIVISALTGYQTRTEGEPRLSHDGRILTSVDGKTRWNVAALYSWREVES